MRGEYVNYQNLIIEMEDKVVTLTLNRPDQRNALSSALRAELKAFMGSQLDAVNAVVVTGAGAAFCAGMDLKEKVGFNEGREQWSLFRELFNVDTVFIAAVNGPARGAGLTLVNACDLAVAEPSADFGLPQLAHGIYGGVATAMLQLSLPRKIVGEMVLTGLPISAERAREAGLINRVSEPGRALETAKALARHIADHDPRVLSIAKQMLHTVPFDDAKRQASIREASYFTLLNSPIPEDRVVETRYSGK